MMMLSNLNKFSNTVLWEQFTHRVPRLPLPAWRPPRLCLRTRAGGHTRGC